MAGYSLDASDTNTTATTIMELRSTTAVRPRVFYFNIGSNATPAEMSADYFLQRTTTVGSGGSALTAQALDSAEPAAVATGREADSVEPSKTADAYMLRLSCHQRSFNQWYAAPGFEIVLPAAANGLGVVVGTVGGSSVAVQCTMHFSE